LASARIKVRFNVSQSRSLVREVPVREPVFEPSPVQGTTDASKTRELVVGGLLAALLASSAWISFPIGAVPLTLQVFVVVLIALLLTPRRAAAAVGVYLLLGALGAPVFAGGRAGLGVLFGPTGGYLFGFLFGAMAGAFVRGLLVRAGIREVFAEGAAALTTVLVIYALGWAQLALVTDMGLLEAFAAGVLPFIVIDIAKAIAAIAVASTLRRAGVVS